MLLKRVISAFIHFDIENYW